jgi:hypothetical protein
MFGIVLRKKDNPRAALKERLIKNKEAMLDVMAENIKGARACPVLLGQKCIGGMCEFFMKINTVDKDGIKSEVFRCAIVETPLMLIELTQEIRNLTATLNKEK